MSMNEEQMMLMKNVDNMFRDARWMGYINAALDTMINYNHMQVSYRSKVYFLIKSIFDKNDGEWFFTYYSDDYYRTHRGDIYKVSETRLTGVPWNIMVRTIYLSILEIYSELTYEEMDFYLWNTFMENTTIMDKKSFKRTYYRNFKKEVSK